MFELLKERNGLSIKDIRFYAKLAEFLSLPYEEQHRELKVLGDYLTVDIAGDWAPEDSYQRFNKAYGEKIIGEDAIHLYEKINRNFHDISMDGSKYDEEIWTLKGLKDHPFWNEQRRLAKQLLDELEKIQ